MTHHTRIRKYPHLGLLDLEIHIQYGLGLSKTNSPAHEYKSIFWPLSCTHWPEHKKMEKSQDLWNCLNVLLRYFLVLPTHQVNIPGQN